jgi:hypothetical protein
MARRKGHAEEELPFVALMDTMTNVVGVLIIVLVMIGIGLARTVRKVLSDLPPVTIEEHAKLTKELQEIAPKQTPEAVEEELAKLQQQIKKAAEQVATMDVTAEKQPVKLMDLKELEAQLAARKQERDGRKTSVDQLLADVDKLKAQLDVTPQSTAPAAVAVKLPNPRPLPDKAVLQHFLIHEGRVLFLNEDALADEVETGLKKQETELLVSGDIIKDPNGRPVMVKDKSGRMTPQRKLVFDPVKLAAHFKKTPPGTREIRIDVPLNPHSPAIPLVLKPQAGTGETPEQAKRLASEFQALLRKFKSDPKSVVWFHVYKDSIPAYLALRDLAGQLGLPVVWDLVAAPQYVRYLSPDYAVTYTPAPEAADAKPTVRIAPPKATLD